MDVIPLLYFHVVGLIALICTSLHAAVCPTAQESAQTVLTWHCTMDRHHRGSFTTNRTKFMQRSTHARHAQRRVRAARAPAGTPGPGWHAWAPSPRRRAGGSGSRPSRPPAPPRSGRSAQKGWHLTFGWQCGRTKGPPCGDVPIAKPDGDMQRPMYEMPC